MKPLACSNFRIATHPGAIRFQVQQQDRIDWTQCNGRRGEQRHPPSREALFGWWPNRPKQWSPNATQRPYRNLLLYTHPSGSWQTHELLARLADEDVNLLAFSAVPYGSNHAELTIFPDRIDNLLNVAKEMERILTGPQHAVLINGDDRLGALAEILKTLLDTGLDIYASTGVTDGQGGTVRDLSQRRRLRARRKGVGKVDGAARPTHNLKKMLCAVRPANSMVQQKGR